MHSSHYTYWSFIIFFHRQISNNDNGNSPQILARPFFPVFRNVTLSRFFSKDRKLLSYLYRRTLMYAIFIANLSYVNVLRKYDTQTAKWQWHFTRWLCPSSWVFVVTNTQLFKTPQRSILKNVTWAKPSSISYDSYVCMYMSCRSANFAADPQSYMYDVYCSKLAISSIGHRSLQHVEGVHQISATKKYTFVCMYV